MPYGQKQTSEIETLDFNACKIMGAGCPGYSWGNLENYGHIIENNILDIQSEPYFQFVHCEGVHAPHNMDKYLNTVEKRRLVICVTAIT